MTVLITGGAGFIGSHLSERLLRDGHQAVIVDHLNDFYDPALEREILASVRQTGDYLFFPYDITDEPARDRIFRDYRPECVVHLAGRAGVRPSLEQPLLYEHVNVRGTLVLLECCRQYAA